MSKKSKAKAKQVVYGDHGFLRYKPRAARFVLLGNLSPELERTYAAELAILDRNVARLRSMSAHQGLKAVRGINDAIVALIGTEKEDPVVMSLVGN